MFIKEDNTYNDIREKSLLQWLNEMEKHEDVAVRGGVKLAKEYIQHLKDENKRLDSENNLKNEYLKKVVQKECVLFSLCKFFTFLFCNLN